MTTIFIIIEIIKI